MHEVTEPGEGEGAGGVRFDLSSSIISSLYVGRCAVASENSPTPYESLSRSDDEDARVCLLILFYDSQWTCTDFNLSHYAVLG